MKNIHQVAIFSIKPASRQADKRGMSTKETAMKFAIVPGDPSRSSVRQIREFPEPQRKAALKLAYSAQYDYEGGNPDVLVWKSNGRPVGAEHFEAAGFEVTAAQAAAGGFVTSLDVDLV